MKRFRKILVAIDTRLDDHPILEKAVEVACFNRSTLTIVDVVPEIPWAVRVLMKDHEHMHELMAQEKQEKLEALAEPIRKKGIQVEARLLTGKTSVEIIREVLREDHDLVAAVAKGKNSHRAGFFGNTGIRLLRQCPCPVWLITPKAAPKFEHVLSCIDTSSEDPLDKELNEKIFDLGFSISKYYSSRFSVIHTWSIWNEPMLRGRMRPEEFCELVDDSHVHTEQLLDKFLQKQDSSVHADNVHMLKGEAIDLIPEFARTNKVDLVVMGTVARSGLTGVTIGNTAEKILNRLECSVLALKPIGFVSPIHKTMKH